MPAREATLAETTTTLTTARQSVQRLQILRLVLQGSVRELRRYLVRGGDLNARVYQSCHDGSFHVNSEDYRGSGEVFSMSLQDPALSQRRCSTTLSTQVKAEVSLL